MAATQILVESNENDRSGSVFTPVNIPSNIKRLLINGELFKTKQTQKPG
jgi:hypothetical protein